ncbi:MAG: hypothetical protein RLZZ312_1993 [Bacteroidota bacterium]|jgi:hypothetical protein
MKIILFFIGVCTLLFLGCKDDGVNQAASQQRDVKKKELIFATVNAGWIFRINDLQPEAQNLTSNWPAWRLFINELKQKPKSSIGAFQKKSKTLSKYADSVHKTIPTKLQKPAIKARITVILTMVRNLELYMNLQTVQADKAVIIISEINQAINSFQMQLDEMVRKSQIPVEQGEPDLIKIMDTTRAIPDKQSSDSYMSK